MRCAYAQTPLGAIHYAEAGSGDAVLLLHANPRSHRYFRHVLPLLGERHRAIAADIPGFGNSHPVPRPATIRGLAECFVRFLDALGLERAHVVGLHTGNKIAAVLAADWPARVGSVVSAPTSYMSQRPASDACWTSCSAWLTTAAAGRALCERPPSWRHPCAERDPMPAGVVVVRCLVLRVRV